MLTSIRMPALRGLFYARRLCLFNQLYSGAYMWLKTCSVLSGKKICCRLLPLLTAASLLTPGITPAQEAPQVNLQRVKLSAGMHVIDAQVALTPEQRQTGLMLRKNMPQHEGMIFVFEQASEQCFWMKNTLLPLTAAFVANDG
ncbi:MAG: DUF192 domain-containing protein, partial [Polaromonas sp.]